ncbi:SulP family inorganic anion transporter [Wenyingzhuangia aestuarii]|uniref:SulP family inorganic anion transporter n=1 Tax=Wenyingzhuangia aestuarii TaxID=1647582 RepID=UPI00143A03B5|nr:sulfate permease [Wenyingzhuangia aestuarii]NJB82428.1 SulP family sulfate permease [Wenyingzhuangia aestuarii]
MKKWIPILEWLPKYNIKESLKADVVGGFTVGVVLIPQGIAYALIAGLPPIYGLYTALLPQLMYLIFGTSQRVAVGPVAMDSLIVAAGISTLAIGGTDAYVTLTILLAFSVGVIQLLLGIGKLGFIVNFLSKPVISGFSSAAAIVIGINQFKNLSGIPIPRSNRLQEIGVSLVQQIDKVEYQTLFVGLITIVVLITIKVTKSKLPGPLLVVIGGILGLYFFHQLIPEVAILRDIPSGLPSFSFPVITFKMISDLLPIAFTLAIIGFLETISIGKALEKSTDDVMISPNKELIALGMMNMVGSMFKSYPSTASFSRSAVNEDAGSKTGLAALFSMIVLVLVLLFLTPYFYYLPKAVLAGIIIVSVIKLINYKEAIRLWMLNKSDFWMLIATFSGTLFLGIKEGIFIGVILSLIMLIARTSRPHVAVLGRIPNTNVFRNINRFEEVEVDDHILILRFDARVYFANANYFNEILQLKAKEKGTALKLILLDCECINGVDSTAIQMIETAIDFYNDKGVDVYFSNIKGPVRDMLTKSGIVDKVGAQKFFINNNDALTYYKTGKLDRSQDLTDYIEQANV